MISIRGGARYTELVFISLVGGLALTATFLSAAHLVGIAMTRLQPDVPPWFVPSQWGFVTLALMFWLTSLVKGGNPPPSLPAPAVSPALTFVVPVAVAFLYGWLLRPGPALVFHGAASEKIWHFLLVPIGEELLFRGWFYNIVDSRFEGKMATPTNPFPCAGWASSAAFAIWHLQNWQVLGAPHTVFQFGYTFVAGLWLSLLRWRTGGILHSILGHATINLSAALI